MDFPISDLNLQLDVELQINYNSVATFPGSRLAQ